jgi:NCAIR mutase (PurE)-related protein
MEREPLPKLKSPIGVVAAGTSDLAVAEESAVTLELFGNNVRRIYDAGVAGLHRVLVETERLRECAAVIVVAGMEGALPSVVAGLIDKPVDRGSDQRRLRRKFRWPRRAPRHAQQLRGAAWRW